MYIQQQLDGLGKSKFKKLFKKIIKAAAPPHVRMKEMKKAKARKAAAAAYAAAPAAIATPAPQVEPTYYQDPLPAPAPQPAAPQYYPRPMPASPPMQYTEPGYPPFKIQNTEPDYPEPSPSMYPSAMPGQFNQREYVNQQDEFPQWYPPDTGAPDEGIESGPGIPAMPAYEFEARGDDEYDYLEGLAEGSGWMDLFTGAASEAIARSKQKRAQRKIDAQTRGYDNAPYTNYGTGGLNMMSLMPLAIGIGAYFLLRKKR